MPTLLTRPPAPGKSNWGTGVQPVRRTTDEINAEQAAADAVARGGPAAPASGLTPAYQPRNLGTLTSAGLNRPGSYPLGMGARPTLQPTPDLGRSWGQPNGQGGQNLGTLTSDDLVRPAANYNAYAGGPQKISYDQFLKQNPGSPAAGGAPPAPQQTERANPLTGADSDALPGTSTVVARPPFISRAGGMPRGQDETVGSSMRGTYGRLADIMGRRFSNPGANPASVLARAQLY